MKYYIERFFQVGEEVPESERFSFDSMARITTLLVIFAISVLLIILLLKCKEEMRQRCLKIVTTAALVFYSLKYIGNWDDYILGLPKMSGLREQAGFVFSKLPLNLCNLSLFSNAIAAYTKKRGVMAFCYSLMIPGAVLALVFPERPYLESIRVISFDYFQFYMVHGLALFIPIVFLIINWYRPSREDFIGIVKFMSIVITFLFTANYVFNTNLCFLHHASPGTPMVWFYETFPQPFYAMILFAIGCVACYIMLLIGELMGGILDDKQTFSS